MNTIEYG